MATITVSAGGNTKTVVVSQYGSETVKVISTLPGAELDPDGGSVTVTYAAIGEVKVSNRNNGSAKNAYVIEALMKGAAAGRYPM